MFVRFLWFSLEVLVGVLDEGLEDLAAKGHHLGHVLGVAAVGFLGEGQRQRHRVDALVPTPHQQQTAQTPTIRGKHWGLKKTRVPTDTRRITRKNHRKQKGKRASDTQLATSLCCVLACSVALSFALSFARLLPDLEALGGRVLDDGGSCGF